MFNLKQNVLFSITTSISSEVVIELGIAVVNAMKEFKLFIKKIETDGFEKHESYVSKQIDFLQSDDQLTFFNEPDKPELVNLERITCSLTNVHEEAILTTNLWGNEVSIKVPGIDAVYF